MSRISDKNIERMILAFPLIINQLERLADMVAAIARAAKVEPISPERIAQLEARTKKIRERTDAIMAEIATAENGGDDDF